ncbi:MAG: response regulator [Cyanobacteria bacterium NC_groundwater_1444_Ag_S-0.65um_54_12]|nr:response regulator [Cyanobacteria bacterium NC_groundwater_1444_Ag_S-0.65um_54_12]
MVVQAWQFAEKLQREIFSATCQDRQGKDVAMSARASVLVIDDELGMREMLKYELSQDGFVVETAENGLRGLEALKGHKFDIIVTDLKMPGMDGVATIDAIRSIEPDIPVIVATAYGTVETAVACMKRGAHDYIQKPFDVRELKLLIERAMELRHLQGIVALHEASKVLSSVLQQEDLVRTVLELTKQILLADEVGLVLSAEAWRQPAIHWTGSTTPAPPAFLEEFTAKVKETSMPLLLPPFEHAHQANCTDPASNTETCSAVAYPLKIQERFIGAVIAIRESNALRFTLTELRRGEVLANQLAIALDRQRIEVELRLAHKLEAVGQLAAGIAHELNTPIQYVGDSIHFLRDAFVDLGMVLNKYQVAFAASADNSFSTSWREAIRQTEETADLAYLTEQIPKAFDRTLDGITRVASIVRAMKDFAHPTKKEKGPADLKKAILSTLVVTRNEYKYVAEIETELENLPPVVCHLGELNQVFLNLIVNAAHAIAAVVGASGAKGHIRIQATRENDEVIIAVSDTGCGIPEEIRGRIFDPFFTTKEVGLGSGQGLAIARSIVVDKHQGSLTFESQFGQGTTFFVRLPIEGKACDMNGAFS